MNDAPQITRSLMVPKLGVTKMIFIALLAAAIGGHIVAVQRGVQAAGPRGPDLTIDTMIPVGCLYGLVAAGCWLATAIDNRYLRLTVRAVLVMVATLALGGLRETRVLFQTAADFTGLATVQSLLFFWLRIPAWRLDTPAEPQRQGSRQHQFAIADLVITTTIVAVLLALMIRYSPAVQPLTYWAVGAAAWTGGAVVAWLLARAMLTLSVIRALLLLSIASAVAYGETYAIAAANSIVEQGQLDLRSMQVFAGFYGRIVAGFVGTFAAIAALGRVR